MRSCGRSRSGALRLRAPPRERLSRDGAARPKTFVAAQRKARGPADANETGEKRASRCASHFGFRRMRREGMFSPRERIAPSASGISVASFVLVCAGLLFGRSHARGSEAAKIGFAGAS